MIPRKRRFVNGFQHGKYGGGGRCHFLLTPSLLLGRSLDFVFVVVLYMLRKRQVKCRGPYVKIVIVELTDIWGFVDQHPKPRFIARDLDLLHTCVLLSLRLLLLYHTGGGM